MGVKMWMFLGIVISCLLTIMGLACSLTQPLFLSTRSGAVDSLAQPIGPQRLRAHVEALASSSKTARNTDNIDRLNEVSLYIRTAFEEAGARVREQPYSDGRYHNVIANFAPDDSGDSPRADIIVVGAHYDVYGDLPGADDNASGIAGLIELAHALGAAPRNLTASVELVAYTLEEPPHFRTAMMGSAVHARSLKEQNVGLKAMLALEMIGYFSDEENSQTYPSVFLRPLYPSTGNYIAVVGKFGQGGLVRAIKRSMRAAADLPVHSLSGPTFIPGVDFSDHLNYWKEGYTAAMITDTAFMRNPNYHEATDTPDTLDYVRMAQVVTQVYAAVLDLSAAE